MTTPINPYVAGNPVGDSPAFIGRADVLREVLRVLRRPQDNAIVLYGQRRIGKTSILQHLEKQLPKEEAYRPVYFDLQDKAAWPLGRVLGDLARTITHTLGRPDPDLGTDPETAFRQAWLPATLNNLPAGATLVLLLDEFDVLADPKAEQAAAAFFPYLRDLMSSHPGRLKFVFVIGRNVNDLTNIALSLFKGTPSQRVSLLTEQDTADLVRLSQKNNSLIWPDEAVGRIWQLTHGHPFLTQQLCSHVWERAYDQEPERPPTIAPSDVDAVVTDVLEASRNTMEWLWDGLPPAERVVISALAEAGPRAIVQDELERLLRDSGVRVLIRELQNAPQLLQDWDLIEPANGGYCFRVELLRQWLAVNEPLRRVQEELDRVEPVAENFYQAALGLYRGGQLERAVPPLRQAIALNPNHVGANQLLVDILLAQGKPNEAIQLLERLHEYQPSAARPRLVQALLAQAQTDTNQAHQLALYERILELDPSQVEVVARRTRIWLQRSDAALAKSANPGPAIVAALLGAILAIIALFSVSAVWKMSLIPQILVGVGLFLSVLGLGLVQSKINSRLAWGLTGIGSLIVIGSILVAVQSRAELPKLAITQVNLGEGKVLGRMLVTRWPAQNVDIKVYMRTEGDRGWLLVNSKPLTSNINADGTWTVYLGQGMHLEPGDNLSFAALVPTSNTSELPGFGGDRIGKSFGELKSDLVIMVVNQDASWISDVHRVQQSTSTPTASTPTVAPTSATFTNTPSRTSTPIPSVIPTLALLPAPNLLKPGNESSQPLEFVRFGWTWDANFSKNRWYVVRISQSEQPGVGITKTWVGDMRGPE